MELEMETKTSTTKPDPSKEDETSPLMEVNSSATEPIAEAQKIMDATGPASSENRCFKWCGTFFLSVLFGLSILIFTLPWIIKIPDHSPTFRVDSISVSSLNVSVCQISSNWNISFIFKNSEPGQPMYYDAIRVLVLYENEFCLSIGNVESFYLRSGQESLVQAWLVGSSENVEKWVVSAIETDVNTRREMNIFVVFEAFVTMNPGIEKYTNRRSAKVLCNNLKVQLSSDDATAGSMSSGNSTNCRLKFEDEREEQDYWSNHH